MKKVIGIFIIAFVLNLIWENLHAPLYFHPDGEVMTQKMLLAAALLDAAYITLVGIFFLKAAYFRDKLWYSIILGLIVAVFVESRALAGGHWAYTEAMPIIPLINTGLTPTIQLGLLSYLILKYMVKVGK